MRYIHGGWDHLFGSRRIPTDLRICFDTQHNRLFAMEVQQAVGFRVATKAEIADVEDSIRSANCEAIAKPADYGLLTSGIPPAWASACCRVEDSTERKDSRVFDNAQAVAEGWDLFDVDGRIQLQRIDAPELDGSGYDEPKFASDADALIFVALQAHAGAAYHREAIERIGTRAD
jgi:hypothetical protein